MRRAGWQGFALGLGGIAVVLLAIWLWGMGGAQLVAFEAAQAQRTAQNAMARGLRALRNGEAGAFWSLMGICFAYGFFHAAGPGHGKMVLAGYGVGRAVTLGKLAALALVSSLAQAAVAVALVLAGVWVLGWGRDELTHTAERVMAPLSYGLMALLGLYLMLRGARGLLRQRLARGTAHHAHDHHVHDPHVHADRGLCDHRHNHRDHHDCDHDHSNHDPSADAFAADARPGSDFAQGHAHDHSVSHRGSVDHKLDADGICSSCGHRHAPSWQEVAALRSWREAAAIVAAIAARPCTGAIFLLLLTWRLDVLGAGVAGAFAMGAGTATVTVVVAILAVVLRGSVLGRNAAERREGDPSAGTGFDAARLLAPLAAVLEIAAGAVLCLLCLQLLLRAL